MKKSHSKAPAPELRPEVVTETPDTRCICGLTPCMCGNLNEELERVKQQLDTLVGDYSRDTEVLRGQVKYAEQQRDALLAAAKLYRHAWFTGDSIVIGQMDADAAIAAAEGEVRQ